MKIYENLWKSMKSMKTYGNLWKSMKANENLWTKNIKPSHKSLQTSRYLWFKNNMSEDFSILMGVLAPMFKAHVQGNLGKLILIPSRGDWAIGASR